jgi:flagellar protein FliS
MNPFRTATARAYQEIGLETGVAGASPHQLVLMLLDGALDAIAHARGHMQTGNVPAKGAAISRAIRIISDGLRVSLDLERGGAIAVQLRDLYEYMARRLLEANLKNRQDLLSEVTSLLGEIRTAWVQIGSRPAPAAFAAIGTPAPQHERRAVSYGAA